MPLARALVLQLEEISAIDERGTACESSFPSGVLVKTQGEEIGVEAAVEEVPRGV